MNIKSSWAVRIRAIEHSRSHLILTESESVNVSTDRLTEEYIADVSIDLKQLGFLVVVEYREFTNHFNVLSIMHYLRQLFVVKLDEQIDLTFSFEARKIFNVARVINFSLIR